MIEWYKTPKRMDTQTADRRVWRSKCGHYRVEESTIRYGQGTDHEGNETGYPTIYRAMWKPDDPTYATRKDWDEKKPFRILSEHKSRKAAIDQCEYFDKHGFLIPTKKERAANRRKVKRRKAKHD